jgi:hypothetical protein
MAKNSKNFTISINHHICPIFHAEINLSKLKFNFAHFIGPILTLRGPALLVSSGMLKGLEPKLHDLALSMGENKTLNLKDITLLKLFQDTCIMLLISISNFV